MSTEAASNITELPSVDLTLYDKFKPLEVAASEGVSEKTVYNRIKTRFYKSYDDGQRTWVLFPKAPEVVQTTIQETTNPFSEAVPKNIEALIEKVLELSKTVTDRDSTITALNHQLQAAHVKLVHVKEGTEEKSEIGQLQKQLLQKQLRPWWKKILG